jgi:hypothetical protein
MMHQVGFTVLEERQKAKMAFEILSYYSGVLICKDTADKNDRSFGESELIDVIQTKGQSVLLHRGSPSK